MSVVFGNASFLIIDRLLAQRLPFSNTFFTYAESYELLRETERLCETERTFVPSFHTQIEFPTLFFYKNKVYKLSYERREMSAKLLVAIVQSICRV